MCALKRSVCIVSIATQCIIFGIFDVEEYRDLEIYIG